MSLPTLTTAGATYRAAFRAEDASYNGANEVIEVPGLIGAMSLAPRYWDGSAWDNDPTAHVVYGASSLGGGPGVGSDGSGGLFTTDATLISVPAGDKYFTTFIRGQWSAMDHFAGCCGFEAWVLNQCVYLENGATIFQDDMIQNDRGSSRRVRGPSDFTLDPVTLEQRCQTLGEVNSFVNGGDVANGTMDFEGPLSGGVISAWSIGPVQRTASSDFPPGVWTYTATWTWGRVVVVETSGGFLNSTDRENLIAWVEGQDFGQPAYNPLFWMCA